MRLKTPFNPSDVLTIRDNFFSTRSQWIESYKTCCTYFCQLYGWKQRIRYIRRVRLLLPDDPKLHHLSLAFIFGTVSKIWRKSVENRKTLGNLKTHQFLSSTFHLPISHHLHPLKKPSLKSHVIHLLSKCLPPQSCVLSSPPRWYHLCHASPTATRNPRPPENLRPKKAEEFGEEHKTSGAGWGEKQTEMNLKFHEILVALDIQANISWGERCFRMFYQWLFLVPLKGGR